MTRSLNLIRSTSVVDLALGLEGPTAPDVIFARLEESGMSTPAAQRALATLIASEILVHHDR